MKNAKIRILLIEDNYDYAQLITRILSEKASPPMHVEHRANFSQGYERASKGDIDLILLDLNLPDGGDIDTLMTIGKAMGVPVIVLTGTDDESVALKAVQKGAQDYLLKGQVESRLLVRSIKYAIERKKADDALKRSQERFRMLIENAMDLITTLDADGTIKYVSPSHRAIVGYEEHELVGRKVFDFVHPEDIPLVMEVFTLALQNRGMLHSAEFRVKHKQGHWIMLESIGKLYLPDSGEIGVIVNSRDITERKKMEERLRNLSVTDDLTGLYNRRGFMMFADHHIKATASRKEHVLLVLIDLDGLKQINDVHGHVVGDQALIDTASVIKQTFRSSDVKARVSGDEFVVLSTDANGNGARSIRKRLNENFKLHNSKHDRPYVLSVSFGIVKYDPQSPTSIDRLMVKADQLMYEEKNKKDAGDRGKVIQIKTYNQ